MNYFIHTIKGNKTVIYNKIIGSNDTVYPDILINHPFAEDEIADDTLFHIADDAIRQYGNGKVIIAKVADDNDLDYILKNNGLSLSRKCKRILRIYRRFL